MKAKDLDLLKKYNINMASIDNMEMDLYVNRREEIPEEDAKKIRKIIRKEKIIYNALGILDFIFLFIIVFLIYIINK